MKKLMNIFVLVAAAAMALASCQKNEIDGPVNKEVHFTIKAGIAETKTIITDKGDGTYTPSWTGDEQLGVLFSLEESAEPVDFENTAPAGDEATFEGKHAFTVEGASEVDGNLYAFYPSSAFNKMYSDGGVRLDLKATQYPTSTSFDPSCDLLIAKPCYYMAEATGEAAEVVIDDMYFARMMSVLRINLNSEFLSNETVKSISFDADGVDFTGAMKFNLETGEFVGNQSTSQDLSEVKAVYSEEDPIAVAGEKNSAYLVLAPVTIPSGTTLTFTIETEDYDIVKTVTAPADMVMPAGNIAVINLTIAEENCTPKVEDTSDYSGTYAIIAENSNKFYYLTNVDNGAGTKRLNSAAEMTSLPESGIKLDASLVWNIVKNEDGTYLIQSAENELYLDHTSGNSSVLVANVEDAVALTIKETEGKYAISYVDSNSEQRNFVKNSSNPYFAFYTSEQCGPVYFVPAEISMDPTIIVADEDLTQSVDAEATELSFNYQVKNISGVPTVRVADGATMTDVSASAAEGTVTVTFAANGEETPKSATITLSYEGATPVNVVINQAAKAAAGAAYYEKVTSAPAADWSGTYLIVANTNVATVIEGTWLKFASVEINDNKIGSTDIIDAYAVTIEKVVSQSYYTIKLANGQYLGTPSSNSIKQSASAGTDFYWKFSLAGDLVKIEANAYSGRILRLNGTSGFRTYTSTTGTQATLYKLIGGEGGETPEPELQERNLAFSLTTATATVGEDFTEPTLSGATTGVTYSSSNTSVATVNETTGAVTLVAAGETTITATAAADATHKAGEVSYTLTVSAAQGGGDEGDDTTSGTHYVKVTSTPADWSGTYLIVYEDGNVAFDGGLSKLDAVSNTVSVTISNNQIEATDAMKAASFTINNSGHIQAKSGKYVGNSSDSNALPDLSTAADNTLSIDASGNFVVKSKGGSYLRYNAASNQNRFRYYKASSYTGQKAIQLYKLN